MTDLVLVAFAAAFALGAIERWYPLGALRTPVVLLISLGFALATTTDLRTLVLLAPAGAFGALGSLALVESTAARGVSVLRPGSLRR